MEHLYKLKRYDGTETNLKADFIKAIAIYHNETPATIKANSSELVSWIQRPLESHFEVLLFILYCDNEVVGLSMMTFYRNVQVMEYEYIAIKDPYATYSTYFTFMDLLNSYTIENGYDILYWITEINNKDDGKDIDKESILFKKLLCINQFGKVCSYYSTLPLGLDKDSTFDAILYIKTNDHINEISKEKVISIIQSIKEYYRIWYKHFMTAEEFDNYVLFLNKVYEMVIKRLPTSEKIPISYIDCPLIMPGERTHLNVLPQNKALQKKRWIIPLGVIVILGLALTIAFFCLFVFKKVGEDIAPVSIIIGNVLSALFSAFFIWLMGKRS